MLMGKLEKGLGGKRPEDHHHIFELWHNDGFAAYFNYPTPVRWTYTRKKLLVAGAEVIQEGGTDGIVRFDQSNEPLVRLILKLAGVRIKRNISDEQRAAIKARFARRK